MILSIGQFSSLCDVPITTLRFWDKKGVFSPAFTDKFTGYRYYDSDQLELVHIITALQKCGLSNSEIKRCLPPGLHSEIYAERISVLRSAKQRLENSIRSLSFYIEEAAGRGVVVTKSIPEMTYLSVRRVFSDIHEIHKELAAIVAYIIGAKIVSSQPFQTVGIIHEAKAGESFIDYECLVRVKSVPKNCPYALVTLPKAEQAAAVIYKGTYEIPFDYYKLLLTWIEENGYAVAGPTREWFITNPYDGKTDFGRHISEMQIPIRLL
jgi:DNA-binding transcriptional MerR regulator